MDSDSINNMGELSGALSSLNIGSNNESNNEEKESSTNDNDNINTVTLCANCGKEGGDSMNACNKCDLVAYCNVACKKKHRSKHKKKCERRIAELYDEALFKQPPPPDECPICFLTLPFVGNQSTFFPCCGKDICYGCIHAITESEMKNVCPFCRTPSLDAEEAVKRLEKLMGKGNGGAFNVLAGFYAQGINSLPQDWTKANQLLLKAGELGCAGGYYNLGYSYEAGIGVEMNKKKAKTYYELAAMNGDVQARHNLGNNEYRAGNIQRAFKHFIISAKAGCKKSLENVKHGYMNRCITKDEYANTLRESQKSQDEMKSDARDKALTARNQRMGG
jgi:TPR repeat protein